MHALTAQPYNHNAKYMLQLLENMKLIACLKKVLSLLPMITMSNSWQVYYTFLLLTSQTKIVSLK